MSCTPSSPGAVTYTPRTSVQRAPARAKSGARSRTVAASGTTQHEELRRSVRRRLGLRDARARRAGPAGASHGIGRRGGEVELHRAVGVAGRAQHAAAGVERGAASGASRPVSQSTCALASVACPQRSTSTSGVNQRRSNSPSGAGRTKAVSECFISAATVCIHASSARRRARAARPRPDCRGTDRTRTRRRRRSAAAVMRPSRLRERRSHGRGADFDARVTR